MYSLTNIINKYNHKAKILLSLVLVNFFIAGIGFMTQIKIANILGKDGFGLIAFAVALSTYSRVFVRLGTDKTLVRDLIHFPEKFGELVISSLVLRYAVMLIFIFCLLSWKLLGVNSENFTWGVVLIVIGNSLVSLDLQAAFDSSNNMVRHAFYKLIYKSIYFMLIWVVILFDPRKLSIISVGLSAIISAVVYVSAQYYWLLGECVLDDIQRVFHDFSDIIRGSIKGNVLVLIAAIGSTSIGYFNQLVLSYYYGISELGVYAAAWILVTAANLLLMQIMRVAGPAIARLTRGYSGAEEQKRFLSLYVSFLIIASSPLWLAAITVPDIIIQFLFKPEFASAANMLRVFGVYIIILSVGIVASQYLINARMEKSYFKCVTLGWSIGLVISFILIPKYGALGTALAVLFTHSITILFYWATVGMKRREQA